MREEPTWRIPVGIFGLLIGLAAYAAFFVGISDWITEQHVALQTVIYIVLGVAWLLPLKRFLIWMETGRWSAPKE